MATAMSRIVSVILVACCLSSIGGCARWGSREAYGKYAAQLSDDRASEWREDAANQEWQRDKARDVGAAHF